MGNARAHAGHSRSSHSTMAIFCPAGGFSMDVSAKCVTGPPTAVCAVAPATPNTISKPIISNRFILDGRKTNLFAEQDALLLFNHHPPARATKRTLHAYARRLLFSEAKESRNAPCH